MLLDAQKSGAGCNLGSCSLSDVCGQLHMYDRVVRRLFSVDLEIGLF
jgi:hypothetical protein